jgi:transcriptional regulator PpsR
MKQFKAPGKSLGSLGVDAVADAIAASADIALVIDRKGVIQDLAFASDELHARIDARLHGKAWSETVTSECRMKVAALLDDAAEPESRRWRQLNHSARDGSSIPVLYSAIRIGHDGNVLAVGRDLRPIAELQQRAIRAEQAQERDYARLRLAETRYRLLFQLASEPVIVVAAESGRIVDANPAAAGLLDDSPQRLVGRAFSEYFAAPSVSSIDLLLAKVRTTGRAEEVRGRLAAGNAEFRIAASLFRQDDTAQFLIRMSPGHAADAPTAARAGRSRLHDLMESLPDGLVVTSPDGRVLAANCAFLELVQLASDEQLLGESLARWLDQEGGDFDTLTAALRKEGSVRQFPTRICGAHGAVADVDISAVAVLQQSEPCFGFVVRKLGRHRASAAPAAQSLPRSVDQLTELVGKVALKDLVRETTDVIERLCIEAALQLTQDNRASAAEMLGLSRQSLYVKLRRFGLGDLGTSDSSNTGLQPMTRRKRG